MTVRLTMQTFAISPKKYEWYQSWMLSAVENTPGITNAVVYSMPSPYKVKKKSKKTIVMMMEYECEGEPGTPIGELAAEMDLTNELSRTGPEVPYWSTWLHPDDAPARSTP